MTEPESTMYTSPQYINDKITHTLYIFCLSVAFLDFLWHSACSCTDSPKPKDEHRCWYICISLFLHHTSNLKFMLLWGKKKKKRKKSTLIWEQQFLSPNIDLLWSTDMTSSSMKSVAVFLSASKHVLHSQKVSRAHGWCKQPWCVLCTHISDRAAATHPCSPAANTRRQARGTGSCFSTDSLQPKRHISTCREQFDINSFDCSLAAAWWGSLALWRYTRLELCTQIIKPHRSHAFYKDRLPKVSHCILAFELTEIR